MEQEHISSSVHDNCVFPYGSPETKHHACYPVPSHLATRGNTLSRESIVSEVRAEISRLQQVLSLLNDGSVPTTKPVAESTGRLTRQISAAGRARIAAATRARWAKIRAEKADKVSGNARVKPRKKMSAAARKRIAATQRARWAKIKAAKK
jgi:hypothetical protein